MVFDSILKFYVYISVSLLFLNHSHGIFELVPSGEVFVCPGLNQLEVVCSTDERSFLELNLTFPAVNGTFRRIISDTNVVRTVTPIRVGNIEFTFAITKHDPLISRVLANWTSTVLNGGIIWCAEQDVIQGMGQSSEVVLHIVDTTTAGSPTVPVVQVSSEQFGMNNVTVILEWINEGGGVSYNASVTPESLSAEIFTGNGTQGVKLVLLYNTQYSLSTVATLCEENSAASITELNYVNCGKPVTNPNVTSEYNSTLVGSQLLLWCENADDVTTVQCSDSATWIPDPTELVCSLSSTSTAFPTLTSTQVTRNTPTDPASDESMTDSGPNSNINVEINWTLVGIGITVGVLFGVIILCVLIAIIIVAIIRKGFGRCQHDEESIPDVQHQEKDIDMSKNIVYEQVKWHKQKIILQENVAYCSTSECVSPYVNIQ